MGPRFLTTSPGSCQACASRADSHPVPQAGASEPDPSVLSTGGPGRSRHPPLPRETQQPSWVGEDSRRRDARPGCFFLAYELVDRISCACDLALMARSSARTCRAKIKLTVICLDNTLRKSGGRVCPAQVVPSRTICASSTTSVTAFVLASSSQAIPSSRKSSLPRNSESAE